MVHKAEWFIADAFFEPLECVVGNNVSGVAGIFSFLAHLFHSRIVIRSLSGQDVPVVEAGRVGFEVPFAEHSGFVTYILQQLGEGLLAAVELKPIVYDAVDVAVFARQDYRPTGAQIELVQKLFLKSMPSSASRSRFGVWLILLS